MEDKIAEMLVGKGTVSSQKEITDLICYHPQAQEIFKMAKSINPSVPKVIGFCAAVMHILMDEGVIKLIKRR